MWNFRGFAVYTFSENQEQEAVSFFFLTKTKLIREFNGTNFRDSKIFNQAIICIFCET